MFLILYAVIFSSLGVAYAIPYHGSQRFLGHQYWTVRYPSLAYTDWDGFWNNYYNGRVEYERASSETSGKVCMNCGCDDLKQELKCSGSPIKL